MKKGRAFYNLERKSSKKKANFSKGRTAWMYAPDKLEAWLKYTALAGNELLTEANLEQGFIFNNQRRNRSTIVSIIKIIVVIILMCIVK
ncbi:hypothetical protein [Virgibacillus pantothenticus]|uniref:hypothetical protein n=1 Tax=Virgibacillus pantothenticus TaxID=1473 RepID=UPI001BAF1A52|nr:hypothetical protein [Virgibacillus pantothenticus]